MVDPYALSLSEHAFCSKPASIRLQVDITFINVVRSEGYIFFHAQLGVGRVVRWCWVNFQCRGVLLIWIRVGQGPTAPAVGAGGSCLDIFLSSIISLFSFSLSLGDGPI